MDLYVSWIHETGKQNNAQVIWSPQTQKNMIPVKGCFVRRFVHPRKVHSSKLTWQWNMDPLKMYFHVFPIEYGDIPLLC